eukprot:3538786-Rhodomonas_salina.3
MPSSGQLPPPSSVSRLLTASAASESPPRIKKSSSGSGSTTCYVTTTRCMERVWAGSSPGVSIPSTSLQTEATTATATSSCSLPLGPAVAVSTPSTAEESISLDEFVLIATGLQPPHAQLACLRKLVRRVGLFFSKNHSSC